MTLTSAVDDPGSVLRRFLAAHFPAGAEPARRQYRDQFHQQTHQALAEMDLLRTPPATAPSTTAASDLAGLSVTAALLGQAFNLRLALAFTSADEALRTVRAGVAVVDDLAIRSRSRPPGSRAQARAGLWSAVAELGHQTCQTIAITAADLALDDRTAPLARSRRAETRLAQLAVVAASFEVVYRNPAALPDTLVVRALHDQPRHRATLNRLLRHVPEPAVHNLITLTSAAAAGALADLRATTRRAHAGVTLAGSAAIGNAEADLITDHTLLEIKTTATPHRFRSTVLWQLLGYALLDHDDTHQIRDIALYTARGPALIRWPLAELLHDLGATEDLPTLRRRLRHLGQTVRLDLHVPDDHLTAAALRLTETAPSPPTMCWVCDAPLPPVAGGGRRRYCSPGCRRTATRARRATPPPIPPPTVLTTAVQHRTAASGETTNSE